MVVPLVSQTPYRCRDAATAGNKFISLEGVHSDDGGIAQQAAKLNPVTHALARYGNQAHRRSLIINHANGSLIRNNSRNGAGASVAGDSNHIQAHGANAGHSLQLF